MVLEFADSSRRKPNRITRLADLSQVRSWVLDRGSAHTAKDRRRGIEGPLLQGGPQVGDPLLDLLQPSRSLRLQALTFSTALMSGTLPDLLQL